MKRNLLAVVFVLAISGFLFSAEMQTDIVYAKRGDRELKLDFITPGGTMRPLLICIHGGGWRAGNKRDFHDVMKGVAANGVAAATVQYRLTDEATWPAQIDDVRAAHKYLVDNAEKLGIDPERIAVTGGSAGGHLALMLGLGPKEQAESLRVRGIVNLFGPAELRDIEKIEHVRELVEALVDGKLEEKAEALSDASPVTIADRTDPPVLTFHGTDDEIVPYECSTRLAELGENVKLVSVKGGSHNNLPDYQLYQTKLGEILGQL